MKLRKFVASGLLLAMVSNSIPLTSVAAVDTPVSISKEAIMNEYRQNVAEAYAISATPAQVNVESYMKQTVHKLNAAGFEAYYVSSETYDEVETELKTDLSDMQLSPEYSYIITLGEDSPETRERYGNEYSYTYNGTTYTMRTVTVDASDGDVRYSQSKPVDMLSTFGDELIQSILNTVITSYADYVSGGVLGTLADILGFDYTDYQPSNQNTLTATCYVEWTRTYHQVLSPYDSYWYNGAYTEYADYGMDIDGRLYNNNKGRYDIVSEKNAVEERLTAPNYTNKAAVNRSAVVGFLGGYIVGDSTGGIEIEYEDTYGSGELRGKAIAYFPETF